MARYKGSAITMGSAFPTRLMSTGASALMGLRARCATHVQRVRPRWAAVDVLIIHVWLTVMSVQGTAFVCKILANTVVSVCPTSIIFRIARAVLKTIMCQRTVEYVNWMKGFVILIIYAILISRVWVANASTITVFTRVKSVTIMGNARISTANVISTTAASSAKVVLVRILNI